MRCSHKVRIMHSISPHASLFMLLLATIFLSSPVSASGTLDLSKFQFSVSTPVPTAPAPAPAPAPGQIIVVPVPVPAPVPATPGTPAPAPGPPLLDATGTATGASSAGATAAADCTTPQDFLQARGGVNVFLNAMQVGSSLRRLHIYIHLIIYLWRF